MPKLEPSTWVRWLLGLCVPVVITLFIAAVTQDRRVTVLEQQHQQAIDLIERVEKHMEKQDKAQERMLAHIAVDESTWATKSATK